jgi:hypothetical protein
MSPFKDCKIEGVNKITKSRYSAQNNLICGKELQAELIKPTLLFPGLLIALMMEAERTSEMLVNFFQTTRCYNPEGSHLRTHRCENLKSYLILCCSCHI